MRRITELVRQLRQNQTPAERALWQELRGRKLKGHKFLRQQPIIYQNIPKQKFFVADFYCHAQKLVIELDGPIHDFQIEYDQNRDAIMSELGLRVVRLKNEELMSMQVVLAKISDALG